MKTDRIEAIGIDAVSSLWVKPENEAFTQVYREANGVHWDSDRSVLFTPAPRAWSYSRWFHQILMTVSPVTKLILDERTRWEGVSPELQNELLRVYQHPEDMAALIRAEELRKPKGLPR